MGTATRYRVTEAVSVGWGPTFYIGTDPVAAWDMFRKRAAMAPLTTNRGCEMLRWDDWRWVTVTTSRPVQRAAA